MQCKEYFPITKDENSDMRSTVNCQGYAFWTHDNPQTWLNYSYSQLDAWTDVNDALAKTKNRLETNWLNIYFSGRWEDVTNNGGMNARLEKNQWLIAMRVGIDDFYEPRNNPFHMPSSSALYISINGVLFSKFNTYDYHFWYRDNTGRWNNKHGFGGTNSETLGYVLPTDNISDGWELYGIQYYNSGIVYYRITEQ